MINAKITKLYISERMHLNPYDLILELETATLTSISESNDIRVMEVEIVEDLFVAKLLVKEGEELSAGKMFFSIMKLSKFTVLIELTRCPFPPSAVGCLKIQMLHWQSYARRMIRSRQ